MSYSSDMSAFDCYPGSPSPSTSSTLSDSTTVSFPHMDLTDLYSPALGKFMCPMAGCLFSILGCATPEELEQHMSMLSHYPEAPVSTIDPSVTIMDNSSVYDDAWLSGASETTEIYGSPTSSTYEFTFAGYEQPKRFPPSSTSPAPTTPSTSSTTSSSSCDCPHCHATGAFVWPASNKSQKAGANSIYNIPTPLTIQMPGPPTIINVPAAPPPPTRKNTAPSSTSSTPAPVAIPQPQRSNTAPAAAAANQYAVWQQQIQIAQVTEMIAAQQKQRKAHRRQLERSVSPSSSSTTGSVYSDAASDASAYSSAAGVYGYPPRPHPYFASA